jgi:hypothetical protein
MTPSSLPGWRLSDDCIRNVEQKRVSAPIGRQFSHVSSTFLNASHLSPISVLVQRDK